MCSLCLGDFAAIAKRAETLDSRLHSVEKEKMEMQGEMDALKQQLKDLSATVAILQEQMLTVVSEQLKQRTGEKAELETDLRNMSQELAKKDEEINECHQKICELENKLKRREDSEKLLKDRLEQAEKDAEQRQLLLQRSEEIRPINSKKEELERKLLADVQVEPCGKDVCHLDSMLTDHSDHSEKGMYVL